MPSSCTCGAPLPEDARFCHRCGKPQRDEYIEPDAPIAPSERILAQAAEERDLQRVAFANPMALRTAFLVASIASIVTMLPLGVLVAPMLAGFAAAWLYQKRSGRALSIGDGAKLGWMTAVFSAILLTIFISISFSVMGPADFAQFRELKKQAITPMQQEVYNSPFFFPAAVLFIWVVLFAWSSALHIAGGALGARLARRKA